MSARSKQPHKKLTQEEKAAQEAQQKLLSKQLKEVYAIPDLLEALPKLKSFSKNGLNLRIEAIPVQKLSKDLFQWAFTLLKANMEVYYKESWGWSDKNKRIELREDNALYLIAYETVDDKEVPVAYSHFRFDYEQEKSSNVLYMYELQVEERVRGKGIGRFFMQILELFAIKHGFPYVMLTVFPSNKNAMAFYQKLRYEVDPISPSKDLQYIVEGGDTSYEILSKSFKR